MSALFSPLAAGPSSPTVRALFQVEITVAESDVELPALFIDFAGSGCLIASRIFIETGRTLHYALRRRGVCDLLVRGVVHSTRYAQAQHMYFYSVTFQGLEDGDRAMLSRKIAALRRCTPRHQHASSPSTSIVTHTQGRASGRHARATYRVAWPFAATFCLRGIPGEHRGRALDISVGGMRLATNMILHQAWIIELTFTLPSQVLDVLEQSQAFSTSALFSKSNESRKAVERLPFAAITAEADVVPGVQESRGGYIHGLRFRNIAGPAKEEIARFVHAVQLSKRHLAV